MNNNIDSYNTQLSAACLLLSVAKADEIIDENELKIISEILNDFFLIDANKSKTLIEEATMICKNSTDLFQFGTQLNRDFNHQDKIDFICCIFEVAYADGNLHYLEHHTVKKIANILNLHRNDIIEAKKEIESYLD